MRRGMLLLIGFTAGLGIFVLMIGNMLGMECSSNESKAALSVGADHVVPGPAQPVETLETADLTLPYCIPGTTLVAENLVQYEGGFLEDGTNDEVVNVVGLVLRNRGEQMIHSARVILERGTLQLAFHATYIPPNTSVLVLESDRKKCIDQTFTNCSGWQTGEKGRWLDEDQIKIEAVGMGTLCLTNLSTETLEDVTVCYKNYLEHSQMYVGGITNRCYVGSIEPGQRVEIKPYHYARGYTKILGVTSQ